LCSPIEAEVPHRLVLIVRAAPELQVANIHRPAFRERDHVMELEKACLFAATTRADEGAPAVVSGPNLAFHGSGDVSTTMTSR
jgi:hypothetical protein